MTKPNYALLLTQIAQESNPVQKQLLIDQCYVFTEPLTLEEKGLFDYVSSGYLIDNPSAINDITKSYVGVYFDANNNET